MNWKAELDKLDIHPTPGENGWPGEMHVPNVRGLHRGAWLRREGCGVRGCLVGHVGCAFLDGPYIDGRTNNKDLPPESWDFMKLLMVRLGVPASKVRTLEGVWEIYGAASDLFEHGEWYDRQQKITDGEPPFETVVEAWLDVTEYCGYVVTPSLRKRMLREV